MKENKSLRTLRGGLLDVTLSTTMTPREKQLEELLANAQQALAQRDVEIKLLQQKLDLLIKRVFGSKSEKLDPAQLELLLSGQELGKPQASCDSKENEDPQEEEAALENVKSPARRKTAKEPRLPDNLPVLVEKVIIPAEVQANPQDWQEIGEDHQDLLDVTPASYFKIRTINKKFRHKSDKSRPPHQASMPPVPIPGTHCAPGLAAHLIVAKYCDHLPHYRQSTILRTRHQINLGRQTLTRWTAAIAARLQPITRAIRHETLTADYLQIDETPIRYLVPGTGKTAQGYLWIYYNPRTNSVAYQWSTSRSHQAPLEWLGEIGFKGILQCDGYSAYLTLVDKLSDIRLAACLAHIRRKIKEASNSAPRQVALLLRLIAHLYRIENRLRNQRAGPALREAVRAHQSAPLYQRIEKIIRLLQKRYLPQHPLRKALDYALGQWDQQLEHLHHGRVEIDNNLAENAVRPTKLGMKNWLFFGSGEAGHMSAEIYTLIENCKRQGLNPESYLKQVLEELPQNPSAEVASEFTPSALAKRQKNRRSA